MDVLGHGELSWSVDEPSIEWAALQIQCLIEQPDTGATFRTALSVGVAVAMRLALNAPWLVGALVLLSPWSRVGEHTRALIDHLFRLAEVGDMASYADLFLSCILSTINRERHIPKVARLQALPMPQDAKAAAYTWNTRLSCDVGANLGDIRAPNFVVTGLHDFKPFSNSGCPRYTVGMSRHGVTAEPWALIAPLIPKPKAGPGRQRHDDRRTLHGLFFILQTGGTGAEVPRVDGAPATCWRRFCAWSTAGLWERRWRALRSPREAQGKLAGAQAFLAGHFVPVHNRAMGSAPRQATRVAK